MQDDAGRRDRGVRLPSVLRAEVDERNAADQIRDREEEASDEPDECAAVFVADAGAATIGGEVLVVNGNMLLGGAERALGSGVVVR